LLTGIYNNKFPEPKYNFIWDVEVVVKLIASWPENKDLDLKSLSKKLMLLALTSIAKSS